jgi:hypothetical protein
MTLDKKENRAHLNDTKEFPHSQDYSQYSYPEHGKETDSRDESAGLMASGRI